MKISRQGAFSGSAHLNETQLIAYLDGELPRAERELARDHLESCWTCRSLRSEVQCSIEAFLDVRMTLLPEEPAFSETRVEQFRQRLSRHASSLDEQPVPFKDRLASLWAHSIHAGGYLVRPRQAITAAVLVATMLVVMFTDVLNTRVSADTVLARASKYESSHSPAAGQVSRTSLRVERIDGKNPSQKVVKQLGTVTVLHDSAQPEMYIQTQAVSGQSKSEIVSDYQGNNQDLLGILLSPEDEGFAQYVRSQHWVPDISAEEFHRLGSAQGTAPSAKKEDGALDVSYQFGANPAGIAEALLQVDPSDYAPTSISFLTNSQDEQREYRFTRTAFSLGPRTPEIAELFAPLAATTTTDTTSDRRKLPALSRPTPLSYSQTRASAEEVAVSNALHKADACLGEEIYIFPMSDGSLLVQGLVDSNARREAIIRTLVPIAHHVRVEIYLPREIKSGSDLYNPPEQFAENVPANLSGDQDATLADLSSGQSPLYERLNQHFSQPGVSREDADKQVAVFSNEVVTIARQTFLHAWALKRLDGEFSMARTADLSSAELHEIDQMRQDHRRWIATLAKRESEMLVPLAASSTPLASSGVSDVMDTDTLVALAQTQNELVKALFADSRQAAHADANLSRLLAVARRMGS